MSNTFQHKQNFSFQPIQHPWLLTTPEHQLWFAACHRPGYMMLVSEVQAAIHKDQQVRSLNHAMSFHPIHESSDINYSLIGSSSLD